MENKKRSNRWIYIIVALLVVLISVAVWQNRNKQKGEEVEIEKVERRTIGETVGASGKIFPVTEVKLSSDVSGEIVELFIEEGDSVRLGQLLGRIDPDTYQSQVERGQAGVNSSKAQAANALAQVENLNAQKEQVAAQLANAKDVHERNKKLIKDGVISEVDFQSSQTNLRSLEANARSIDASIRAAKQSAKAADFAVKSAEATLKELRTSLRKTDIYAPMTGIVSLLNVEKGERVVGTIQMAGTEMLRVADLSQMEVQVDVSENDIPRVTLGDDVDIEVDAYVNRKFKGKVSEIAHSASNMSSGSLASLTTDQVTNFVVTIMVDTTSYQDLVTKESPFPFRPGMSASVDIHTEMIENTISIPIQAVTTRDQDEVNGKKKDDEESEMDELLEVVFVKRNDTVDLVEVKTGIQDDSYIEIISGLEADEEVVVGPYSVISRKLEEGDQVFLKKKDGKKKKKK